MAVWQKVSPQAEQAKSVLFLDRDGVMIVDQGYLADPAGVELLPGVAGAISEAQAAGLLVIGVSNQSGLGRGLFSLRQFELVMARMTSLLAEAGAILDGFYYCPHAPEDACACRKPRRGLLDEVAQTLTWPAATSWMVGDKKSDVALGREAGMGSVLVDTGYGLAAQDDVRSSFGDDPRVFYAADMPAALSLILARPEMQTQGGA